MRYPYLKRLPAFEYLAPASVEEALTMISHNQGQIKVLAGGTDLLLKMKMREESPRYLVGLKNIQDLDYIRLNAEGGLRFGAAVTVHAIETSALIREKFPILAQAAAALGSVQVRNLATVVGNLCSALPSSDMAPGLIVLGSKLKVLGPKGERTVAVEDFFKGPGVSALDSGDLVTEVQVPPASPHSGMVYLKHMLRSAMDLSIVGVAVNLTLDQSTCLQAKICLGTVGPTPQRALKAETVLKGNILDTELIEKAARTASEECDPRSTMRASADYRKEMVNVLTVRALTQAREQAETKVKS
jgi:carbon-monoxide dehydrogenase medium subunit